MDRRVYDDGKRTAPKVPGLNASNLQPSIGTDRWATRPEDSGQTFTAGSCFKARPIAGHVPGAKAEPSEVRKMALDEAANLARTRREDEMVRSARLAYVTRGREGQEMRRIAEITLPDFEALSERTTAIGTLIREALGL